MDAKLRKICVICSAGLILLLVLLMYFGNQQLAGGSYQRPSATNQPAEAEVKNEQLGNDLKAFLQDADFFDPQDEQKKQETDYRKRISLMANSVEKDLRVRVVDSNGDVVKGENFVIQVGDLGEYRDDDADGVIHVSGLAAGEYPISLQEMDEFHVSTRPVMAKVKEKIEYYPIEDISLLMKTEAEVVAANEDAMVYLPEKEGDETEISNPITDHNNAMVGIDVSKWNGDIDWYEVTQSEVSFAIIRAGYRGYKSGNLIVDPYFETNMRGAADAGIYRGVYFFTQAVNTVEAVEEASMVIELLKDYNVQYPIFIDTESTGANGRADGLDTETRTQICEAFCRTIKNAGYEAGVYASRSWYQHQVEVSRLEQFHIWLAEYRKEPLYEGYYEIWQHTSKGSVSGIHGNVDMNLSFYKVLE